MVVLDTTGLFLLGGHVPFEAHIGILYKSIFFLMAVLSWLGIVGNIISLIVWTRPQLKSTSAILLTALAATDLVTVLIINSTTTVTIILSFLEQDLYLQIHLWNKLSFIVIPHASKWVLPVFNIAQTASVYLTLAITLERYIAVCHPFEFKMICTYSRACKSAASIIIFSILYNLCRFWEIRLIRINELSGDEGLYWMVDTELKRNPQYISVYRIWLYLIINYLLPLAGIVILNSAIYLKLKIANRERKTLTNLQKIENRLTRMLICVVVEFLVCTSVTGFVAVWNTFDAGNGMVLFGVDQSNSLLALSVFFNTFNSSVNFVTYVCFGGPFRKRFVETFCCCCCKERAQPMLPGSPREQNRTSDTESTK